MKKTNVVRRILPQHIVEKNIIRVIFNEAHTLECIVCKLDDDFYTVIDTNSSQLLNIYGLSTMGSAKEVTDNLNKFWEMRVVEELARLNNGKIDASPRNISYEVFKGENYYLEVKEYSNNDSEDDFDY